MRQKSGHFRVIPCQEFWTPNANLVETDGEEWAPVRRGWCLGSEGFKKELLEQMEGRLGEHHAGQLRRESAKAKAEQIIGGPAGVVQSRAVLKKAPYRD